MARKKMQKLCFGTQCTILGTKVVKHPLYSIRFKMWFGCVSEHFANHQYVKRCKTCVSGLNALFRSWMQNSCFANLRHVMRWKTYVSARNTLFQDTEVAKHPFDYIGPKMMFESVSEHFTNLWHMKRSKSCVLGQNALFWVPKLRSIHSTP
jgi:hypothetical protein